MTLQDKWILKWKHKHSGQVVSCWRHAGLVLLNTAAWTFKWEEKRSRMGGQDHGERDRVSPSGVRTGWFSEVMRWSTGSTQQVSYLNRIKVSRRLDSHANRLHPVGKIRGEEKKRKETKSHQIRRKVTTLVSTVLPYSWNLSMHTQHLSVLNNN